MTNLNDFVDAREYISHVRDMRKNDAYELHVIDVVENLSCHVCQSFVELIDEHENFDTLRTCVKRVKIYKCVSCEHEIVVEFDQHDCLIC